MGGRMGGEAARLGFLFARSGGSVRLRGVGLTRAPAGARWTSWLAVGAVKKMTNLQMALAFLSL